MGVEARTVDRPIGIVKSIDRGGGLEIATSPFTPVHTHQQGRLLVNAENFDSPFGLQINSLSTGVKEIIFLWMEQVETITQKLIRIKTLEHRSNGLLIAISDDIPGLSVVGYSVEEIKSKMDGAIRDFLEMAGHKVISLELAPDTRLIDLEFGPPAFIAHASLSTRHSA